MNKILLIFFFLLLTLIIGEGGYYFFVLKPASTITTAVRSGASPKITITPTYKPTSIKATKNPGIPAVSPDTLSHLSVLFNNYKKNVLTESSLNNQLEGKVVYISTDEWVSPNNKVFKASIRLKANTGEFNTIFFNQTELDNLIILKIKDGAAPLPLNFSEIANGDYVTIKQKVNLLKNDFFKGIDSTTLEVRKP